MHKWRWWKNGWQNGEKVHFTWIEIVQQTICRAFNLNRTHRWLIYFSRLRFTTKAINQNAKVTVVHAIPIRTLFSKQGNRASDKEQHIRTLQFARKNSVSIFRYRKRYDYSDLVWISTWNIRVFVLIKFTNWLSGWRRRVPQFTAHIFKSLLFICATTAPLLFTI